MRLNFKSRLMVIFFAIIILTGCNNYESIKVESKEVLEIAKTSFDTEDDLAVISEEIKEPVVDPNEIYINKVNSLTLEEKVAQLFIITPEALTGYNHVTKAGDVTKEAFFNYPVGGIILMGKNIENPEQLKSMTENLQLISKERLDLPMFISTDEEGGQVARIASNPNFNVKKYGNLSNLESSPEVGYNLGFEISNYLKDYGINLNYAPVCDVITSPKNKVVAKRAFSGDAKSVSLMVSSEIEGFKENGIFTVAKHFPGHGNTAEDSHYGYAFSDKTLEEIREVELLPFIAAIEKDVDMVMMGHISMPNITGTDEPASMSTIFMEDILRQELGFEGIIITDALNMGALVHNYSSDVVVTKAINSGVDVLLMPYDFVSNYNAVINAVNNGEIKEERIDESVLRILKLKDKINI